MWRALRYVLGPALFLISLTVTPAIGSQNSHNSDTAKAVSSRMPAKKLVVAGVPNVGEVTPKLYRGGQPTEVGFQNLRKMGIKIVVDTHLKRGEEEVVTSFGMKYISIPWHCPWPKDSVFDKFLQVIRDNPDAKIFVHCRLGNDRTGMMIASYRMADQGWDADEAMREMQDFGFSRLHHFICPGLAGYEKHFPEHLRSRSGGELPQKTK